MVGTSAGGVAGDTGRIVGALTGGGSGGSLSGSDGGSSEEARCDSSGGYGESGRECSDALSRSSSRKNADLRAARVTAFVGVPLSIFRT